ncbi:MAG: YkvA family protein [Terrimicrobiaceae bacterium]|nr:YkvA family protein [Terrimicrobiaceae bacterium]
MTNPASPGSAISLDDYLENSRSAVTAAELEELRGFEDRILAKLDTREALAHRDLQEGARLLLAAIFSRRGMEATDPLPIDLAEAAVALRYLLKGVDLIPDSVPEIGLTDDARLVACVLDRNPELAG